MRISEKFSSFYDRWPNGNTSTTVRYLLPVPFSARGSELRRLNVWEGNGVKHFSFHRGAGISIQACEALALAPSLSTIKFEARQVGEGLGIELRSALCVMSILAVYPKLVAGSDALSRDAAKVVENLLLAREAIISEEQAINRRNVEAIYHQSKIMLTRLYDRYLPSLMFDEIVYQNVPVTSLQNFVTPFLRDVTRNQRTPGFGSRVVDGRVLEPFTLVHWKGPKRHVGITVAEVESVFRGERNELLPNVVDLCLNRTEEAHYMLRSLCEVCATLETILSR